MSKTLQGGPFANREIISANKDTYKVLIHKSNQKLRDAAVYVRKGNSLVFTGYNYEN